MIEHENILQVFKDFYVGPMELEIPEYLVQFTKDENELHFVSYCKDKSVHSEMRKCRPLRKLHESLVTKLGKKQQYWHIFDEAIAKQLGIDTDKPGDIYLIRRTNLPFN